MNNTVIVKLMTNLIEKKFYGTKDEAVAKLDIYFAMTHQRGRIRNSDTSGRDNLRRSTDCLDILRVENMENKSKTVRVLFLYLKPERKVRI